MQITEKTGTFLPSALQNELLAASIPVLGVTAITDENGNVTAVQINCEDGADQGSIDTVCTAHDAAAESTARALAGLRAVRDGLLSASDWTQTADSPLDDDTKNAWATYRTALRGYPDQDGFDPLNPPAWPDAPAS